MKGAKVRDIRRTTKIIISQINLEGKGFILVDVDTKASYIIYLNLLNGWMMYQYLELTCLVISLVRAA